MGGEISRENNGNTKIDSAVITIEAELTIPAIATKAIEWITSLCTSTEVNHATDYQSASSATGANSIAMNIGRFGKSKASKNGAIVVCAHDDDGNLVHIRASKIGDNGIKPDVFYTLNKDGEFVEDTE